MSIRPTVTHLVNAGVRMNLARGGPDERQATRDFMALFERAAPWSKVLAAGRIVRWRYRSAR